MVENSQPYVAAAEPVVQAAIAEPTTQLIEEDDDDEVVIGDHLVPNNSHRDQSKKDKISNSYNSGSNQNYSDQLFLDQDNEEGKE